MATQFAVSFEGVIITLRAVVLAGPVLAYLLAVGICRALRVAENERRRHGRETGVIVRLPSGAYVELSEPRGDTAPPLGKAGPGLGEMASASTEQRALVGSPPP